MSHEHLLLRRRWDERVVIYTCVAICFGGLFGIGGIAGIYITHKIPNRWLMYLLVAGFIWAVILIFVPVPLWLYWGILSLPTCGIASMTWHGLLWLHELYLHPITWDRSLSIRERWYESRQERRLQTTLEAKPTYHDHIEMGMVVAQDVRKRVPDSFHIRQNYLWADELFLNQHILLIGAPGSGKSEAIKHIISEILSKTDRDVFIVDGKGELDFAHAVKNLFQAKRGVSIPIFQMGTPTKGDSYNGFVGTPEAIKQRLTSMFNIEEQSGDGEFYANVNRALLNLVCLAPEGTPRSLTELDERLSLSWLRYCYRGDAQKSRAIDRYEKWFDGLRVRADSLIWDFTEYLSPDGFSLDDVNGAVFSLRTAAMGDTSRRFLNFIIEDFKDWVGKRQKRPAMLVIDEFGQFENQSIVALIELARSANLGILLATQDLSTVREKHIRERLLSSIQTKILMKTDTPEVIGELGGTYTTAHLTYQMDEIDMTGLGSIRLEDERKVDLNAVRRFPPGRAYLIRSGVGMMIQFRQLTHEPSGSYPPKIDK